MAIDIPVPIKLEFPDSAGAVMRQMAADVNGGASPEIAAALHAMASRYLTFINFRFNTLSRGGGEWPDLAESTKRGRDRAKLGRLRRDLANATHDAGKNGREELSAKIVAELKRLKLKQRKRALVTVAERERIRIKQLRKALGETTTHAAAQAIRKRLAVAAGLVKRAAKAETAPQGVYTILKDSGTLFRSLSTGQPGSIMRDEPGAVTVGTAIWYAVFHQEGGKNGRPPQRKILVPPDEETMEAMQGLLARGVAKMFGRYVRTN